jgi:hypothetical protein
VVNVLALYSEESNVPPFFDRDWEQALHVHQSKAQGFPKLKYSPRDAQRDVSKLAIKSWSEIAESRQGFLALMIGSEGR